MVGFKADLGWKRARPLSDVPTHQWAPEEAWDAWIVQECAAPVHNKFTHFSKASAGCVITRICGKNAAFCNLLWGWERGAQLPVTPCSFPSARAEHTVRAHLRMQQSRRGGAGAQGKQSLERFQPLNQTARSFWPIFSTIPSNGTKGQKDGRLAISEQVSLEFLSSTLSFFSYLLRWFSGEGPRSPLFKNRPEQKPQLGLSPSDMCGPRRISMTSEGEHCWTRRCTSQTNDSHGSNGWKVIARHFFISLWWLVSLQ